MVFKVFSNQSHYMILTCHLLFAYLTWLMMERYLALFFSYISGIYKTFACCLLCLLLVVIHLKPEPFWLSEHLYCFSSHH